MLVPVCLCVYGCITGGVTYEAGKANSIETGVGRLRAPERLGAGEECSEATLSSALRTGGALG